MVAFLSEVDIANRALQHLRQHRISSFADHTHEARETGFAYPRLRDAELRAHLWRFATRRNPLYAIGPSSYLWTPPAWASGTSYALGAVVTDTNGNWWQSRVAGNTYATPSTSNTTTAYWQAYFGPDVLTPFVAAAVTSLSSPAAPTLTSVAGGSNGPRIAYVKLTYTSAAGESLPSSETKISLTASQLAKVTSPAAATGATGYNVYASDSTGTEVLQTSSPIPIGTDWTEPSSGFAAGAAPPTTQPQSFYAGDLTYLASSGVVYLSLVNNNTDTPPSVEWVAVNGTVAALQILYPIGAGPSTQITTRNVFRLPHGFLRQAPTDPRGQANPFLGAAKGNWREDWVFESNYLVSAAPGPILMRYVADFVDVTQMEPAFCEMLAARIAIECGSQLITDPALLPVLLQNARRHYRDERAQAVAINAIEIGPIDMDMSDYISCRF